MTGSGFPATSSFQSPQQPTSVLAGSGATWDVTPEEKARADQFFDGLDVSKQGKLDGAAVVPFFIQSKLTESVLAHVWDLSDITQSGTLSKDEFAVAMHLINDQLAGKPLPQELPSSLVPPSMRNMNLPAAVNPQQSDTQKDLFSLMDDDPPPPTISASSAFITPSPAAPVVGNTQSTPFDTSSPAPAAVSASTTAQRSAPGPFDDDFFGGDAGSSSTPVAAPQPSQPFAAALSPSATGGSFGSAAAFRSPGVASPTGAASPSASTSRLGSAFGAAAAGAVAGAALGSGGNDQSAEYGNKSIQLQSTEKAVSDLQSKRGNIESSVATNASTIAELESRLATVRGQHETESKLVKDLEERQQKQNQELKTLRENVIREESELSALKAEKDELEQALMRDREDVRDMKKRMNDVQTETKSLKEQLEKLRKDARQQKGLVAISKKQLATSEAEQDKVASQIEAVQRGELVDDEAGEHHAGSREAPAAVAVAAAPAHGSAADSVTSPAASVRSNNPFDRFGPGAAPSSQPGTPGTTHQPSVGTSLAAGAGAGAVLGGAVAAATHLNDDDATQQASGTQASRGADPFGVPQPDQQQPRDASNLGFDDAFAIPGESTSTSAAGQSHTQAASTDFDDNFGDDFGASTTTVPTSSTAPAAETAAVAEPETSRDLNGSELAAAGGLGAGAGVLGASAIHAAEPSHDVDASTATKPSTSFDNDLDADGPFGSSAATADNNRPDEPDADEDSSDDEDDGPEDLEGYKGKGSATPVGGAADRFPDLEASGDNAATGSSVQPQAESERTVPGGLEDVTATTVPASSAPVDPSAIGAVQDRTASTTSIAPVSRQETLDTEINEVATNTRTDDSHAGAGTAAAGGVGIAALAAGAGALTLGERGHGDTEPETVVTSPADDNVPLSQLIASNKPALGSTATDSTAAVDPSSSPSLSTKTRRAPPPAPVRSATSLSTTSAAPPTAPTVLAAEPTSTTGTAAPVHPVTDSSASTNPFGMDDFGAAPATSTQLATGSGVQQKATNDSGSGGSNFDDFDSAFEDLGPSEAVPTAAAAGGLGAAIAGTTAAGGANSGFDDAFDNDFDFVPSFSAPGANAAGAGQDSASRAVPATSGATSSNNAAFDDFDAAFDSTSAPAASTATTTTATAAPAFGATTAATGGHADRATASNTTSGFSFEDAFDPSSTNPSTAAPAINTTSMPTPGAASATSTSNLTSPIAPQGTYAPPPGPPPGFTGPTPPAVPPRSGARAGTGSALEQAPDFTGALPDDAGQAKQLCGMGFTRQKVIEALEKSNYRTEKALERLLAST
ncbi:hypothetical protein NDA16_003776 [Ustilago loliicola]|nr:hypothetical protein NDA16_003776 [Ustilago loliicola]